MITIPIKKNKNTRSSRTRNILLIVCSSRMLTGCFGLGGVETTPYTFADTYTIGLPDGFTTVSPSLVENQQIINKVLLSLKKKQEETFDENIVITKAKLGPSIDYEQFRSVNSKKMQTGLVGYIPGSQQRLSFECEEETINGLLVTFDLRNTYSGGKEIVSLAQYQFVHRDIGYIISYATSDTDAREDAKEWIGSVSCGSGA